MKGPIGLSLANAPALGTRRNAIHLLRPDSSSFTLFLFLCVVLVQGVLYAVLSPPFDGPDERAHLEYVAYLATSGASGPIGAEGHQPIGYYALMAPVYWLVRGQSVDVQLLAIRIASIPFMMGTVLLVWFAARAMAPRGNRVPLLAAGFVGLQPGLAYFSASANNDNAANLMGAALTYLVVTLLVGKPRGWAVPATAAAIGVAVLTKGQILPMMAVTAVVLAFHVIARIRTSSRSKLLLYAMVPVVLAIVGVAGRAGERMIIVAEQSGSMVVDWSKALEMIQQSAVQQPFAYMFLTFWTAYLGAAVRPANAWYFALAGVMLLAAAGYVLTLVLSRSYLSHSAVLLRVALIGMLFGVGLIAYLRYLYWFQYPNYPWRMQLLQGHFLHVTMAPLALLLGEGWSLLIPSRVRAVGGWSILALLIAFNVASLAVLVGYYAWP